MSDLVLLRDRIFLSHSVEELHPECPQRIEELLSTLEKHPVYSKLPFIDPQAASFEALLRVHDEDYLSQLSRLSGQCGWLDGDTYYGAASVEAALKAAGGIVDLALKISRREYRRGFALVRPPGHHATRETAMGFCLLNNVAVAAAALRKENPQCRVAIVDFDLHHGNGTESIFAEDPNVLFISSHRFPFYPGTGQLSEVGRGKGKGTTINFPLSQPWGDAFFKALYGRVSQMLRAFGPDVTLVSAGYDGHEADPMRGFSISTSGYRGLSELLVQTAEEGTGKILFCLEGGYNPRALEASVLETLDVLSNFPRGKTEWSGTFEKLTASQEQLLEQFRLFHLPFFPELS